MPKRRSAKKPNRAPARQRRAQAFLDSLADEPPLAAGTLDDASFDAELNLAIDGPDSPDLTLIVNLPQMKKEHIAWAALSKKAKAKTPSPFRFAPDWPPVHWESDYAPRNAEPAAIGAWLRYMIETCAWLDEVDQEQKARGGGGHEPSAGRRIVRDAYRIVDYLAKRGWPNPPVEPASVSSSHDAARELRVVERWVNSARAEPIVPTSREIVLKSGEKDVLEVLAANRGLSMTQEEIENAMAPNVCLSVRTIGEHLKRLRDIGLAHRPNGERGGDAIADAGLAYLRNAGPRFRCRRMIIQELGAMQQEPKHYWAGRRAIEDQWQQQLARLRGGRRNAGLCFRGDDRRRLCGQWRRNPKQRQSYAEQGHIDQ
jgi:hypothetical protein